MYIIPQCISTSARSADVNETFLINIHESSSSIAKSIHELSPTLWAGEACLWLMCGLVPLL